MLGSSCSPCCGPAPCTLQDLQNFYDSISASTATITITGTSDERDGATILPTPTDTGFLDLEVVYVYHPTVSPVGEWEMAINPSGTAFDPSGNESTQFAAVSFLYQQDLLRILLFLRMQRTWAPSVQTIAWPGTSCRVSAVLTINQTIRTVRHAGQGFLGELPPQSAGCFSYELRVPQYIETMPATEFEVASGKAGWDFARTAVSSVPSSTFESGRQYYQTTELVLSQDENGDILAVGQNQTSQTSLLPRFVPATNDDGWFTDIQVIERPGLCPTSTGTRSQKKFSVFGLTTAFPANQNHMISNDVASASVTPSIRFALS